LTHILTNRMVGTWTWDSFTYDFMTKSFKSHVLHVFSKQGELTKSNIFTIVLSLSGWRVLSSSYILLRILSITPILRKGSYFFLYAWKLNWLTQSMFLSPTEQAHKVGPHGEVQKKKNNPKNEYSCPYIPCPAQFQLMS
jgi:hypothetical protein